MERESKNLTAQEAVAALEDDCTKVTEEALERAIYAVQVEAKEEKQLFEESTIILRNDGKNLNFLKKLLGIDEERYQQIMEVSDEDSRLRKSEWQELLKQHGLHWEKSDFSEQQQEMLERTAERSRQEAEVEIRFRILINGRNEGFREEDYKDFIETNGYHFSDFEHLLDNYGDKFMGRLVWKFFERKKEQIAIREWKEERKKQLRWKLICLLFLAFIVVIIQSKVVLFLAIIFVFAVALADFSSKPMETV